jgi:GNAT superfamily N-acetyltransferase
MQLETTTAELVIRHALKSDMAAMCALCGELGYPVSGAEFSRRLLSMLQQDPDQHAVYVAEYDEKIVGWIHVRAMQQLHLVFHAEVSALIVTSSLHGKKIGLKLMQSAEKWAQQHGMQEVRLYSSMVRSKDAHWFYQRLGYQEVKPTMSFKKNLLLEVRCRPNNK